MASDSKKNGMIVIPREAMPPGREYPDGWGAVWESVAKLPRGKAVGIKLSDYGDTVNALRCALRRAKMKQRVPPDVRVRAAGELAYLYR